MGIKGAENAVVTVAMPPIYIYTLGLCNQAFKEYTPLCNPTLDPTPVTNITHSLSPTAGLVLAVLSARFCSHQGTRNWREEPTAQAQNF